jgi:hypothetical protein
MPGNCFFRRNADQPTRVIETPRLTTMLAWSIATDLLATDVLVAVMAPTWTRREKSSAGFHLGPTDFLPRL